jgi:hypothetical protein
VPTPPSRPARFRPSPILRNSISYEDRLRRHPRSENSVVICRNKDLRCRAAGPKTAEGATTDYQLRCLAWPTGAGHVCAKGRVCRPCGKSCRHE